MRVYSFYGSGFRVRDFGVWAFEGVYLGPGLVDDRQSASGVSTREWRAKGLHSVMNLARLGAGLRGFGFEGGDRLPIAHWILRALQPRNRQGKTGTRELRGLAFGGEDEKARANGPHASQHFFNFAFSATRVAL